MSGFWGSFRSKLDSKGRINFPAKFRKYLTEEDKDTLILIRGNERCISVYPSSRWASKIEEIRSLVSNNREFGIVSRRLMYQASEQTIDKQGRLNLTAELIQYAQLEDEVLIVGHQNKFEIWNAKKYGEYVETNELTYQNITQEIDI